MEWVEWRGAEDQGRRGSGDGTESVYIMLHQSLPENFSVLPLLVRSGPASPFFGLLDAARLRFTQIGPCHHSFFFRPSPFSHPAPYRPTRVCCAVLLLTSPLARSLASNDTIRFFILISTHLRVISNWTGKLTAGAFFFLHKRRASTLYTVTATVTRPYNIIRVI